MQQVGNSTEGWDYLSEMDLCTLETCPMDYAFMEYVPNLGGNAFFAAWFGILFIAQLVLGIRYKTWAYTFSMCSGLLLEIIGYVGRVLLHDNPFLNGNFLMCAIFHPTRW